MVERCPGCMQAAIVLGAFLAVTAAAEAQRPSEWFGGGGVGWLRQDVPGGSAARPNGFSATARAGHDLGPAAAFIGEVGWLETTLNNDVTFALCPGLLRDCLEGTFVGPTRDLTLAAAIRLSSPPEPVRGYLTLGPAIHWLVRRDAGTRAVAFGGSAGVGVIVRAGARTSVVAEATYRRLLSDGTSPRWMVPVTFGIEVR